MPTGQKTFARKKPAKHRKDESIRVRVTKQQRRIIQKAAEKASLDISSWMRITALEKAAESDEH